MRLFSTREQIRTAIELSAKLAIAFCQRIARFRAQAMQPLSARVQLAAHGSQM
jgi:hypothetical protein